MSGITSLLSPFSKQLPTIRRNVRNMVQNHPIECALAVIAVGVIGYAMRSEPRNEVQPEPQRGVQFRREIADIRLYGTHDAPIHCSQNQQLLNDADAIALSMEDRNDAVDEELERWINYYVYSTIQTNFAPHFSDEISMKRMTIAISHAFLQMQNKKIPLSKRGSLLLDWMRKNNTHTVWLDRETFCSMYCTKGRVPLKLSKACRQDCPDMDVVRGLFSKLERNEWEDNEEMLLTIRNWTPNDFAIIENTVHKLCYSLPRNAEYNKIIRKYT